MGIQEWCNKSVTELTGVGNKVDWGRKQSFYNNIEDNIEDNIDIYIV